MFCCRSAYIPNSYDYSICNYFHNSFNLGIIQDIIKAVRSYVEKHWKPASAEISTLKV
jgi:hypothetical protein